MIHYMITCKHTDGTNYSAELPFPCFKHEMLKLIAEGQVGDVKFVHKMSLPSEGIYDYTRYAAKELSERRFEDLSSAARDLCARFGFNLDGADADYSYALLGYSKSALNWGCSREEVAGPAQASF